MRNFVLKYVVTVNLDKVEVLQQARRPSQCGEVAGSVSWAGAMSPAIRGDAAARCRFRTSTERRTIVAGSATTRRRRQAGTPPFDCFAHIAGTRNRTCHCPDHLLQPFPYVRSGRVLGGMTSAIPPSANVTSCALNRWTPPRRSLRAMTALPRDHWACVRSSASIRICPRTPFVPNRTSRWRPRLHRVECARSDCFGILLDEQGGRDERVGAGDCLRLLDMRRAGRGRPIRIDEYFESASLCGG